MSLSILTSLFITALGVVYAFATFALPQAAFGRPHEPKIFPAILAFFLVAFGAAQLVKEIRARKAADGGKAFSAKAAAQILATIANGALYACIFERAGFVLSTVCFLLLEFLIFDRRIWKRGLVIAVVFALLMDVLFGKLLGIVLPSSPLGFI